MFGFFRRRREQKERLAKFEADMIARGYGTGWRPYEYDEKGVGHTKPDPEFPNWHIMQMCPYGYRRRHGN